MSPLVGSSISRSIRLPVLAVAFQSMWLQRLAGRSAAGCRETPTRRAHDAAAPEAAARAHVGEEGAGA